MPPVPHATAALPTDRTARGAWGVQWTVLQAVLVVAWVSLSIASELLEYAPHASLWFPPTAVTFAGFVLFGRHALPGLVVACYIAVLLSIRREGLPFDPAQVFKGGALYALAHCLPYAVLAWGVRRAIGDAALPSIVRAVGVLLGGGMLAALCAALLGTLATALAGLMPTDQVLPTVLPWLIGDLAGLLAVGPLAVVALHRLAPALHRTEVQRVLKHAALPRRDPALRTYLVKLVAMLASTALALCAVAAAPGYAPLMFAVFAAILLQLWIVHTHGAMQSLVAIALFSIALVGLVAALDLDRHALTLQFVLITLAAATYFGLTVPMLYADNAQLRGLLTHDTLTGVYSRHFFVELASQALRQASDDKCAACVLMIDLDHLKHINDAHGHAVGDRALAHLALAAQRSLGPRDLLGRLSGDEFAALLPGAGTDAARACAERVIQGLQSMPSPLPEGHPSVSIGIACAKAGEDYATLLGRADAALYEAKRGGRGRAVVAD